MIYYFDIDGTLCTSTEGNYEKAAPLKERIKIVNELYEEGNIIHLYTARGSQTKIDWSELTKNQMTQWGVKYHTLNVGKPHYDLWVDDKAVSDKTFFKKSYKKRFLPRETKIEMNHVDKGWGWERWICNGPEYCGKLLFFNKGKKCSWHVHRLKDEVFYLQSGKMVVKYSEKDDLKNAETIILNPGENFHVYRGLRHQMIALEDSELFEFSTQHFDSDSYRLIKGD